MTCAHGSCPDGQPQVRGEPCRHTRRNRLETLDGRGARWIVKSGHPIVRDRAHDLQKSRVRRRPATKLVAIGSLLLMLGSAVLGAGPGDGPRLSDITVSTAQGTSDALSAFKGKPTIVNLWATWCMPCQREMPLLQRAQAEHPDLNFVFLNQGEREDGVQEFLDERALPIRNLLLDPKAQASSQVSHKTLPATLFFDAEGRLLALQLGELNREMLATHLGMLQRRRAPVE